MLYFHEILVTVAIWTKTLAVVKDNMQSRVNAEGTWSDNKHNRRNIGKHFRAFFRLLFYFSTNRNVLKTRKAFENIRNATVSGSFYFFCGKIEANKTIRLLTRRREIASFPEKWGQASPPFFGQWSKLIAITPLYFLIEDMYSISNTENGNNMQTNLPERRGLMTLVVFQHYFVHYLLTDILPRVCADTCGVCHPFSTNG